MGLMQQAPTFLAASIRTAFQTSRTAKRAAGPAARCTVQKVTAPQGLRPIRAAPNAYTRRSFHNSVSRSADDKKSPRYQNKTPPSDPLSAPKLSSDGSSSTAANHAEALPSHQELQRSNISKRFSHLMDTVQSNVFVASQRLNDLTGYSGIEALKRDIEIQEHNLQETRNAVKVARDAYAAAIATRSSSQREVNDLLQRKHAWSPADLERFTELYRSDHANEQAEAKAQEDLSKVEREAEEAASKLSTTILARYHEEQIWSDKIRRMSTWGTWGLMGLNVVLFLLFQVAIEPWRRRRLVRGFEEKVQEALEKENTIGAGSSTLVDTVSKAESPGNEVLIAEPKDDVQAGAFEPTAPSEPVMATAEGIQEDLTPIQDLASDRLSSEPPLSTNTDKLRHYLNELFSDKKILTMTQMDLTTAVLQGAAGGAAMMGLLLALLRPR